MIIHPFMPPPLSSSASANNGSSMPSSSGLTSTSEVPSNNPGSMVANSFHSSHLRGSFAGQQDLLTDPNLPNLGMGISPNCSPVRVGARSTRDSGALNNSSGADDMMAMLQQGTLPSSDDQARRDQLLLQLLLEKHNNGRNS